MSDRKYRHRGYQDDGGDDRPQRGNGPRPGPGPGSRPGPRGRGMGKPTAIVFRCAVCATQQRAADVELDSTCSKCKADVHTCTHCVYFDSAARWECRQPIETRVVSKAKRNGCTFFKPKTTQEFARDTRPPTSAGGARAAFDALFKT